MAGIGNLCDSPSPTNLFDYELIILDHISVHINALLTLCLMVLTRCLIGRDTVFNGAVTMFNGAVTLFTGTVSVFG